MKNELTRYIDLLFAGAQDADDIKQEILQNTLDRYDDLIAQGKSPEAAYRLAISGIGDINEILGQSESPYTPPQPQPQPQPDDAAATPRRRLLNAISIALYILCPLPLFILQDEIGLSLLLVFVAVATAIRVFAGRSRSDEASERHAAHAAQHKGEYGVLWIIAVIVYLGLSFSTRAWYITWMIFPIFATIQGIIRACKDLKEAE